VVGAVAISQPVAAMTVTVMGMHYSNPTTANIHSRTTKLKVCTGAFDVVVDGNALLAWCVDISQATIFGQIVNDYGSASTLGLSRVDALARLATKALGLVMSSETSGAFQLAAWEIVNEKSGGHDLGTGNFKADNV
jgi:hypothetical protein